MSSLRKTNFRKQLFLSIFFCITIAPINAQAVSYVLAFDGIDDCAVAPATIMSQIGNGNFTFETWLQGLESQQNANPIIFSNRHPNNGSGTVLFLSDPPQGSNFRILTLQIEGVSYGFPDNGNFNGSLLDNACHHIAITRKNTDLTFFIDGNFIGQTQIQNQATSLASSAPLQVGADVNANIFFQGRLWEMRIWNETRDITEIQATQNTYLLGNENWLLANWQMNEGADQIAYDYSVYNYDLFLGGTDCNEDKDPIWISHPCPLDNPFVDDNCPQNIIHAEPFTPNQQIYQSGNSIQSTAIIEQGEFIGYDAAHCIDLQAGFEVQPNALFDAVIGGCTPITPACLNLQEPAEQAIIQSPSPTFSWDINPSFLESCGPPFQYQITILKIGAAESTFEAIGNNDVVFSQSFTTPDASTQSMSFPSLLLAENENYIWNIEYTACSTPIRACKWRHFYHSRIPLQLPFEPDEDLCLSDCMLVNESSFNRSPSLAWTFERGSPFIDIDSPGCDDPGFIQLSASPGTSDIISQTLLYPIKQDSHYQVSVCFQTSSPNVRLQVMAFNGNPTSFEVGTDVALIGQSGHLPPFTEWSTFQFPVWTANKNFDKLAFLLVDDNPQGNSEVLIDNICMAKVPENPCIEYEITLDENGNYTLPPFIADLIMTYMPDVVETETEIVVGSTFDLYGHLTDTGIDTWYGEDLEMLPCASIGEFDPTHELDSIDNLVDTFAINDILELGENNETIDSALVREKTVLFDPMDGVPPVLPVPLQSPCGNTITPIEGKPFGGRDIVYVHGLQLNHILGQVSGNFLGKWPDDAADFYIGGEYHDQALEVVNKQIEDKLGSLTSPTNNYLVVSYPADQRLKYGIHAVLTQISNAINNANYPGLGGSDPTGVMWSEDSDADTCFGDELVIVSHSTGGILVSSMLGLGNLSATDPDIQASYGNVQSITNRIKAHIAIEPALSGSFLATSAIAIANGLTGTLTTIIDQVFETFNVMGASISDLTPAGITNTILVDLVPLVSQSMWASQYFQHTSTPTFTAAGSASGLLEDRVDFWFTKKLNKGIDDGVLNMDCECASMHTPIIHSKFTAFNIGKMYDFGRPFLTKSLGILNEQRSIVPFVYNSACISYLSPTGMILPVSNPSTITRWPNHYSITQSTASHYDPSGEFGENGKDYIPSTFGSIPNFEEVRVLTDPTVYTWVHPDFATKVNEVVKKKTIGFHIPWIKKKSGFPWFKFTWKYIEITIWKRTYHLLDNYENMRDIDYLYEYILKP